MARDPLTAFGDNLRRLRLERDLSQEELAYRAGMHRNYAGSVERGERNVALRNIIALADALDVAPGDLMTGLGKHRPK